MSKMLALLLAATVTSFPATGAFAANPGQGTEDELLTQPASNPPPAPPASADSKTEPSEAASKPHWELSTITYLWASGVKTEINTPQGEQVTSKLSFFDVLKDLKFAFMGAAEAKRGRFVSIGDLIYTNLSSSADGHVGAIPLDAHLGTKLLITTAEAGYRVLDHGPMSLDILAGARLTALKVNLELTGPRNTVDRRFSRTEVAPVIAARFRAPLGGRWGAAVYGDVGGFGVTPGHSWQLLGNVQYRLSDRWQLAAGWRHYSVKDSKRNFDVHIAMDGPILGAICRF